MLSRGIRNVLVFPQRSFLLIIHEFLVHTFLVLHGSDHDLLCDLGMKEGTKILLMGSTNVEKEVISRRDKALQSYRGAQEGGGPSRKIEVGTARGEGGKGLER